MLGTGRKDSAGIEHRFRKGNRAKRREEEEEEEENRLSATIATGRGFASRLVGRGPFNRCLCSIGPRYTTDSFCYRGFHPAGPSGPTEGLLHFSPPCLLRRRRARNTNARGLAKGRVRSFTNLASCQEQEDLAHPFLSLCRGEKERKSYSRHQTAHSKTGCQRILAILSIREEETPSPHIFTTFFHSSCFFFFF